MCIRDRCNDGVIRNSDAGAALLLLKYCMCTELSMLIQFLVSPSVWNLQESKVTVGNLNKVNQF